MKIPVRLLCCFKQMIIVLLLLGCSRAPASAAKIDSVLIAIREHAFDDTTMVNLYIAAANLYRYENVDSAQVNVIRGLALAQKIHYEKGEADCLMTIGITWLFKAQYDRATFYLKSALAIYTKRGDNGGISSTLHLIGVNYAHQEKYDTANEYFNNAVVFGQKIKDTTLVSDALDNIGSSYLATGSYPEALDFFLKGLRMREQLNYKLAVAVSLSNIASVYSKQHDYKKALDYADRALALQAVVNNKMGELYTYEAIATIYREMKDNDHAAVYLRKALSLSDTVGNRDQKNILLISMADIYTDRQQYDSAMANYTLCLNDSSVRRPDITASAHNGIGKILLKKGSAEAGIKHMLTAFSLFKDNGMKSEIAQTANMLGLAYMKVGKDSLAYLYNNISSAYRDSIYNHQNAKRIQQLQFDYQLEKKQSQIELLSKTKAISQARLWGLIAGIGLLLVIISLMVRGHFKEQRTRNKIIKQKEEIQLQATKLEELNHFKDKTFSVLAHDMRDPLNAFSSTMSMIDNGIISVDEFFEMKPEMNLQINALSQLLENLLNWAKGYMKGQTIAKPAMANLYNTTRQNIKLLGTAASVKKITIINNMAIDTSAFCDEEQADIVIRNLINNAIKFTPMNGSVTIAAREDIDIKTGKIMVTLSVTDTGVGMTREHLNKLFSSTPGNNTYGTNGEKGTGLGLLLCYEFIKANNGTMTVSSEPGKGSTFDIKLPKLAMMELN
jgi:signal transduction histidine kinase/Tfp pilus assembly protein PilF